jgi:hypothetical protein
MQPSPQDGCVCPNNTAACVDALGLVCAGHGVCNDGACGCRCDNGWAGAACDACDAGAVVTVTLPAGAMCGGSVAAPYDGYQCSESACLPHCTAATTCDECAALVETGCGWCGATSTCADTYTAQRACAGEPNAARYNEACSQGSVPVVAIALGAAAAAVAVIALTLLGLKGWRVRLDRREWAAFAKANQACLLGASAQPMPGCATGARVSLVTGWRGLDWTGLGETERWPFD